MALPYRTATCTPYIAGHRWQARHSKSQMVAAEFKALEHRIRARLQLFAGHILPSGYD